MICLCLCCFSSVAKKTHSVIQTLKKDGVLTTELEETLRSCRSADELDHVVRTFFLNQFYNNKKIILLSILCVKLNFQV